jgi:predicted PurR-regulated permease PerM
VTPQPPAAPPVETASRSWFPPPASILWAVGIAMVVLLVYVAADVVVLFILSAALAYVINPLVKIAEGFAIRRDLAVSAIYLIIIVALAGAANFLVPMLRVEINTLASGSPSLTEQLDRAVDNLQRDFIAEVPAARHFLGAPEARNERLSALIERQTANLPNLLGHMATIAVVVFLIPVFSYFFLRDSRKIVRLLMDRLAPAHIETSVAVWCEIDRIIGRYIRGLAIDGLVIGTIAGLGLWAFGVNYPLLLGVFSGMANVVPYVGPFMSGTVVAVIAMIQFQSFAPLAKVMTLYLCIKFCDLAFIHPMTVGKSVHLHPILLLASILVGGHAFGLIGMVIAVPAVTTLQEVARLLLEHRGGRSGLGRPHNRRNKLPLPSYVC